MDRQKTHWDELSMHEKAKYIKLALDNGVSDLSMVRDSFNVYAGGGSINIKPENRGKFTELKERTGKSSTWYKEHGTPAQKKMATFALNARKWSHKHEDGDYLNNAGTITTAPSKLGLFDAYMTRLVKAGLNLHPRTAPIMDIMGGGDLNNLGNLYKGVGKAVKEKSLKSIGKFIGIPDLLDDAVEFYNALLNRPPEKPISPYFDESLKQKIKDADTGYIVGTAHKHNGTESDSKLHVVKDRLLRNINPATSYDNPYGRLFNALILNKSDYSDDRDPIADASFDKDVIKKSKYAPTKAKDKIKKDYYTFDSLIINKTKDKFAEENNIDFLNAARALPFNGTALGNYPPVLNDFTYSRGFDNKGEYVSVYDKYDINPFGKNKYGDKSFGLGKPFEFYDRLYLDDYYDIPEKYRGTTYLPEIVVTPKAQGGYLQNLTSKPFSYKPIPSVRYDFGGFIRNLFGLNDEINNKTDLIDMGELANRQAYAESGFASDKTSRADARGMFQIVPAVLDDYNRAHGTSYDASQLYNDTINTDVRNWYFQDNLMNRPWINKEGQSDSMRVAKALVAYNYGPANTLKALNKAKANGVDIYNSWDWLSYVPKEPQEYTNFILRNLNNSVHRNNALYEVAKNKKSNQGKVKLISERNK